MHSAVRPDGQSRAQAPEFTGVIPGASLAENQSWRDRDSSSADAVFRASGLPIVPRSQGFGDVGRGITAYREKEGRIEAAYWSSL